MTKKADKGVLLSCIKNKESIKDVKNVFHKKTSKHKSQKINDVSYLERNLALQFRVNKLEVETQYSFIPERKFRFDFALPKYKLAIECIGGLFSSYGNKTNPDGSKSVGRHARGSGIQNDLKRHNLAVINGWNILYYDSKEITSGRAILQILEYINIKMVDIHG